MNGFGRILISIYIGISAYLIASIFFGGSGILAMKRLDTYSRRLEANVSELIEKNGELEYEVESLLSDAERIRLEARTLGYYAPGETVIEYSGATPEPRSTSIGRIMKENVDRADVRSSLRLISFVIACMAYLALSYGRRKRL